MVTTISAELVNGVFGDPALYLDFRDARRALLFVSPRYLGREEELRAEVNSRL